jgi:hypothetical protein
MYDPRNDQEEQQRKIAELLMAQAKKDAANHDMTGVTPQVNLDVPMPAPPPQEISMMDRMQNAFENYQGMAPIQPITGQVTRGGQTIKPITHQMTPVVSQGLLDSIGEFTADDEKKAKLAEMAQKFMGGA